MAGGKASPRQKMINMMYLVLTALLALNVSAEILNSFATIANSLKLTADQLNTKNNDLTHELFAILEDQAAKGKNDNQYLRPVIEEVAKEADKTYNALDFYIKRIENDSVAGYDTVKKSLKAPDESQKSYRYWMKLEGSDTDNEGRGSGEGRKLKDRLNGYVKWANTRRHKLIDEHPTDDEKKKKPAKTDVYKDLCIDPKNDPTVPKSSEMQNKTWEYYTFHGAPAIANIALLQKFKTDSRVIESDMLEFLKGRIVDRPLYTINKLKAVVSAESNRVLAGRDFKAQIFVTMSLKGPADKAPRFSGAGVKPDPRDRTVASIVLKASAATIGAGKNEGTQSYSATVQVAQSDGSFKSLDPIKGSFTVVKPDLEIGAFKLSPLYRDCRNEVEMRSRALGTDFNPVVDVKGGESVPHPKDKGKIALIPNGKTLKLIVFNNFNGTKVQIGEKDFQVNAPPAPDIKIKVDGKDWNPSMKISNSARVTFYAKSDDAFYDALPKDARYQIEGISIKKKCGIGPFENTGKGGNSDISHNAKLELNMNKFNIERGCRVLFEVEKVYRVNFKDAKIDVSSQIGTIQKMVQGNVE